MIHFVIDIETLGLETDAIIESIGLVMIEDNCVVQVWHWYCNLDQPGRTEDIKTIEWRQKHAPIQTIHRPWRLIDILVMLSKALNADTDKFMIWSWRNFDFRLLTHAYEQYKMTTPWKYNQCYDIPSYMLGAGIPINKSPNTTHVAVEDAENEAKVLIAYWRSKGITL